MSNHPLYNNPGRRPSGIHNGGGIVRNVIFFITVDDASGGIR